MHKLTMKLFITGHTVRSNLAIENLRSILEENSDGQFELTVIDVLERPDIAEEERILATPTLIKLKPSPIRKVIGDLSDKQLLLSSLCLDRSES
jgi:circadian clock protein KaiB